jgi:SAM-dependent methyltransferase
MAKGVKNLLIYYIHDRELLRCAKYYFTGRLLDIGCGTKPYKSMLSSCVSTHVGLDRPQPFNPKAEMDLAGTASNIPLKDASFDSVLSTASLEHLPEPESALLECNRVLKQGGIAIYSVPFIWHLHSEPWDYFRFSKYALQHLFEKTGFEIIEINALAGFWTTSATMFCYYIGRFHHGPLRYIPIIPAVGLFVQGIAYFLDKLDKAEEWTWMYMVVAKKKK